MSDKGRGGVAMLLVLLIIPAVLLLVAGTTRLLMVRHADSVNQRTRAVGDALLESGLELAHDFLSGNMEGHPDSDSRLEDFSRVLEKVSAQLESADLRGSISGEQGRISLTALRGHAVKKTDGATGGPASKASDTALIFRELTQYLCGLHGIGADPAELLTSIAIWGGAEDTRGDRAWYASRKPSYRPVPGPLLSPDQLLLLRWPGASGRDLRLLYYGTDRIPGLREFITVWSDGPLDMGAAPEPVLEAVARAAGADGETAREFAVEVVDRRNHGDDHGSASWYLEAARAAGVSAEALPVKALGGKSRVYRIQLAVHGGAGATRSLTVMRRTAKKYQELFRLRY